ncbi:MAG: ComF family protein [Chitinophagaceae bacterium]|nr:ComF family protein [Chitinophagaceae bacterium]
MLLPLENLLQDFSKLFFPHYCAGCGQDLKNREAILCYRCQQDLPFTNFFDTANNPVEKSFFGRLRLEHAAASFYFTKDSLLQNLLIELKYRNNKAVGFYLGRILGHHLKNAERFKTIDALIALPLHPKKQMIRGYNQARIICEGIKAVWDKPIIDHAVERIIFSNTQTQQNRVNRWQNMEGIFGLKNPSEIQHKHLLLVDDVTTSGATLEACGSVLLAVDGVKLSIATVAYTI